MGWWAVGCGKHWAVVVYFVGFNVHPRPDLLLSALALHFWLVKYRKKHSVDRCWKVSGATCWSAGVVYSSYYSKNVVKLNSLEKHLLELRVGRIQITKTKKNFNILTRTSIIVIILLELVFVSPQHQHN